MAQDVSELKLAVLIDADNTSPAIVEGLIAEIAKYGVATVKRIYGDWTNPHLKGWKEVLLSHAIQPIQQFGYTVGKNATDSAMIIDAMDLLYSRRLDGFCLVSSDSDFTRLASRLREEGNLVLGFGVKTTPKPFVGACDKFIFTEILRPNVADQAQKPAKSPKKPTVTQLKRDSRLVGWLRDAVEDSAEEDGWAYMGRVGRNIASRAPECDPRNYGYARLGELLQAIGLFELTTRSQGNGEGRRYVRDKRKKG